LPRFWVHVSWYDLQNTAFNGCLESVRAQAHIHAGKLFESLYFVRRNIRSVIFEVTMNEYPPVLQIGRYDYAASASFSPASHGNPLFVHVAASPPPQLSARHP
jgi:hypothetical protein